MKSDKMPYIIYADIESLLIRKIDGCANNPEKSLTMRIDEHFPCGYSMLTIWGFDVIGKKHNLHCGKEKVLYFFQRIWKIIIEFEKKKMLPLTKSSFYRS